MNERLKLLHLVLILCFQYVLSSQLDFRQDYKLSKQHFLTHIHEAPVRVAMGIRMCLQ